MVVISPKIVKLNHHKGQKTQPEATICHLSTDLILTYFSKYLLFQSSLAMKELTRSFSILVVMTFLKENKLTLAK